jgi:hypothetical protein
MAPLLPNNWVRWSKITAGKSAPKPTVDGSQNVIKLATPSMETVPV